ncbi:MAG TPA: DUF948 domain-containing protein [Candidatus Polarisedimenticolaceae bacterium]|nr:DUF948 domain-containing protein [Candidatus Polarisedimenticolaceae bacterium]
MQAPAWIAVLLFAVLVAVAVPVLLQLRRTLAKADQTLEVAERRLDASLRELTTTLTHINRSAEELEKVTQSLGGIFRAFEKTGGPLQRLKSSLRTLSAIPSAVGPMLVAAVRGALGVEGNGQYEPHRPAVTKEMM